MIRPKFNPVASGDPIDGMVEFFTLTTRMNRRERRRTTTRKLRTIVGLGIPLALVFVLWAASIWWAFNTGWAGQGVPIAG